MPAHVLACATRLLWVRLEGAANSGKRLRLVEILRAFIKDKRVRLPGRGGCPACLIRGCHEGAADKP